MPPALQSVLGIACFIAISCALSEDRARIPWRTLLAGTALQFLLAAALLRLPVFRQALGSLNDLLHALELATQSGTAFVFGYLAGGELPFAETGAGSSFILAFRALPLVLLVSALSALLFYWRVLPL
ncbi:MAG TPA: Na+ dependent nucleoside transporter N-terminal domain-containing protein, partial [Gammaproteobacteria bacterium]|nr:Na+ dependent nucleoside transporter N-terminal domain-containing protein [Gammaproteobacteria bacterium]